MDELEHVKAGDKVVVCGLGYGGTEKSVQTVGYATKTQVFVPAGKFRRKDGRLFGAGMWDRAHIKLPTSELLTEAENQALDSKLGRVEWRKLRLESKRTIWGIVSGGAVNKE